MYNEELFNILLGTHSKSAIISFCEIEVEKNKLLSESYRKECRIEEAQNYEYESLFWESKLKTLKNGSKATIGGESSSS